MITGLFHTAIRTEHLRRTINFYEKILGLKEVPRSANIRFPGAWLALPVPNGNAIIYLYAGEAAVGEGETLSTDNSAGVVDHLALQATGFNQIHQAILDHGLNWRAQNSNPTNLQLFVHDPNGLKIEMSFNPASENGVTLQLTPSQTYRANERFFEISQYLKFD
jgi:catechol 2,3-dioxygenase-like lactoylglutathione lyase family enzyme